MNYSYKGSNPQLHSSVFVADGARIIGDVQIEEESSVWFNAVLRADLAPITIGKRTNIQDGVVGHVNTDQPLIVGDDVSIGHGAIIHGCTIKQGALIGMGAIVLNGAVVGENTLVGAGSVVTENTSLPPNTLCFGTPARAVRTLDEDDLARLKRTSESYVLKGREFADEIQ